MFRVHSSSKIYNREQKKRNYKNDKYFKIKNSLEVHYEQSSLLPEDSYKIACIQDIMILH